MTRVVAGLVAAFAVVVVVYNLLNLETFSFFGLISIALVPFAVVGSLLIARIPRNAVGWLLSGAGVCLAIAITGNEYATVALINDPGGLPAGDVAAGLAAGCVAAGIGLTAITLLVFPSGRGLGGRWTWIERALMVLIVLVTFADLFRDVPLQIGPETTDTPQLEIANPFALHGAIGQLVLWLAQLIDKTTIPLVLIGPLSLFVRYRRATTVEREQIKWLAYAGTLALTLLVLSNAVPGDLGNALWPLALVGLGTLPIAIAVAIFRYHLYDIDLIIRRTLVYGAVSAVLLASYVGGVALFESLLAPFTSGNGIAVAISTLAVVALFQPVRRRIQSAVDHRFFRARYDAQHLLDAFAARLRDEVDLEALERELVAAVRDTVQPSHASVWLRTE